MCCSGRKNCVFFNSKYLGYFKNICKGVPYKQRLRNTILPTTFLILIGYLKDSEIEKVTTGWHVARLKGRGKECIKTFGGETSSDMST
jgi:hypothetical protein